MPILIFIGDILLSILNNIFNALLSPTLTISTSVYKGPLLRKDMQKKKDESEGLDKEWYNKYAQRRRISTPESYKLAHSHHGSLQSLDDDANRNWSNEHGNLSPPPWKFPKFGIGDLRRGFAGTKDLDADNNRNWSNEHGNLSPESLSPLTPIFTPSSSGTVSSGPDKVDFTPSTLTTDSDGNVGGLIPTTARTVSTSEAILTPSETPRMNEELLGLDRAEHSQIQCAFDDLDNGVYDPNLFQSLAKLDGFDLADHLLDFENGYFPPFGYASPAASEGTVIYTPATTSTVTSISQAGSIVRNDRPNLKTTTGSTVIYTLPCASAPSNRSDKQLKRPPLFEK